MSWVSFPQDTVGTPGNGNPVGHYVPSPKDAYVLASALQGHLPTAQIRGVSMCDCQCALTVKIIFQTRIGSGSTADEATTDMESRDWGDEPLPLTAGEFLPIAYNKCYSSASTSNGDGTSTSSRSTNAPMGGGHDSFTVMQGRYKWWIGLPAGATWTGQGADEVIALYSRIMTLNSQGAGTVNSARGPQGASQSGGQNFTADNRLELVPSGGASFAQDAAWREVGVPGMGEEKFIVGPGATRFLHAEAGESEMAGFFWRAITRTRAIEKVGFISYTRNYDPEHPVDLYLTETASQTSDSMVSYSGYARVDNSTDNYLSVADQYDTAPASPPTYGRLDDSFSATIDYRHKSSNSELCYYIDADGNPTTDVTEKTSGFEWQKNAKAASLRTATKIVFANGLIMQLSEPSLSSVLTDYGTSIGLDDVPAPAYPAGVETGPFVAGEYSFPKDELALRRTYGKYRLSVFQEMFPGVVTTRAYSECATSNVTAPAFSATESVAVTWEEETANLDTGAREYAERSDALTYHGYAVTNVVEQTTEQWRADSTQVLTADATRQRRISMTNMTLPDVIQCLAQKPLARIEKSAGSDDGGGE